MSKYQRRSYVALAAVIVALAATVLYGGVVAPWLEYRHAESLLRSFKAQPSQETADSSRRSAKPKPEAVRTKAGSIRSPQLVAAESEGRSRIRNPQSVPLFYILRPDPKSPGVIKPA